MLVVPTQKRNISMVSLDVVNPRGLVVPMTGGFYPPTNCVSVGSTCPFNQGLYCGTLSKWIGLTFPSKRSSCLILLHPPKEKR